MNLLCFLLIILPALVSAQSQARFTVVASKIVRQGKPYNVHVRGYNIITDVILIIRFTGKSDTGDNVEFIKTAKISADISKANLVITTDTITKGNYSLIVEGENYFQRKPLIYSTRTHSFLIQFNKGIQKPNDILKYRIYAIDSDTNAVNPTGPNNITIIDPKGNLVILLSNVAFVKGKHEGEFKLAAKTVLGTWRMKFFCGEEIVMKNFYVSEYNLPLISGEIIHPSNLQYSDEKIPISIDIKYAFGRNPIGTAKFSVYSYTAGNTIFQKDIYINSTRTSFELNMESELQLIPSDSRLQYQTYFDFYDQLTEEYVYAYKNFEIHSKVYTIKASGIDQDYLRPGFPYKFKITVQKKDGTPAPAGLKLHITPQYPTTIPEQTLYLEYDSTVTSFVDVPIGTYSLQLNIKGDECDDGSLYAYSGNSGSGSFLDIKVLDSICYYTENCPKLNKPVNVKLTSGEAIEYATVHLISKGILLKTLIIPFDSDLNEDDDPKTVRFSFTPTVAYLPETHIFAYYFNKYGNFVIAESVSVGIKNDLSNYVKINPITKEVRPGTDAKFSVESLVNSTVSLVAVDQRVIRYRSDGNITLNSVFGDFAKFQNNDAANSMMNSEDYYFSLKGLLIFSNFIRNCSDFNPSSVNTFQPSFDADIPEVSSESSQINIREDFSDSFLWRDVDIKNTLYDDDSKYGYESIIEQVPDSMTKYFIYGVSMSSTNGLGLSEHIPSFSTFMPFFISVEFPYSMRLNEVLTQDIAIYNYLPQPQTIQIKISSDKGYEALYLSNYGWNAINGSYSKTITTTVGQHAKVQFALRPKTIGVIIFEITAKGPVAGDGLKKQLRVIPYGIARSMTKNVLIPIETSNIEITETLQCNLPPSAYQDTTEITATVSGDLFAKTLNYIENLILLPYGCCEQTASNIIPNIVAYRYLLSINKLTPVFKTKLEGNILTGFQKFLSCQNSDGSYSIFTGGASSTWVTAYIIQYLNIVSDIVTIDQNIIAKSADFLVKQQQADGSFFEAGNIIYNNIQSKSRKGVAMTAFCSIALSSLLEKYPQYEEARDKSIDYLESQYRTINSTYDLGIVAYALQLADSGRAYKLFYEKRTETPTMTSWILSTSEVNKTYFSYNVKPEDIEITSYGLLAAISREEVVSKVIKIVQFLVSNTNRYGGYGSSHDTTIALNALSQFAKIYALGETVTVKLIPNIGTSLKVKIAPKNIFTLQSFQLNPQVRNLKVKASSSSSGVAIVSLTCDYYDDPYTDVPQFAISYLINSSCADYYSMQVCVKYTLPGSSNMGILSVSMLSGFQGYSSDKAEGVRLIESIKQGTELYFYFDSIDNTGHCVTVFTKRINNISNANYGYLYVYDYYDTTKYGSSSYSVPNISTEC